MFASIMHVSLEVIATTFILKYSMVPLFWMSTNETTIRFVNNQCVLAGDVQGWGVIIQSI